MRIFHINLLLLAMLACAPCGGFAKSQAQGPPGERDIVILYSYGDGIPAYQQATRAFLSVMIEAGLSANNLFFEYLDLERKNDSVHLRNLRTLFLHKYAGRNIGLVVTVHRRALNFILCEGAGLFPGSPVLSYLGPDVVENPCTDRPVAVLPLKVDIHGTLELALKLFPQTERVVFINGAGEGEKRLYLEAQRVFEQWRDALIFQYTHDLGIEEILRYVAGLPPRTIVLYGIVFRDKNGGTFVPEDVADRIAKAANAPVFGMYNTIFGNGILGGLAINFEMEGARAARAAIEILRGELLLAAPVNVLSTETIPMFDSQQLKRWGLKETLVPRETVFVNRPFSFWDEYKYHSVVTALFLLVQFIFIVGLMIQKRQRKLAEDSLRQKTEELDRFFNVSADLLCIAKSDGSFLRLNPAWEKILGHSREALAASRFFDFVHPDDLESTGSAFAAGEAERSLVYFENRYRCRDGSYRWLEWTAAQAKNLIYAAARDITERLKAETEARHRKDELAHLSRIAIVGEMATSLAHEINQPLTAIHSNAEAAKRFLGGAEPDVDEVLQILDDIIRDDRRASEVIRKVRSLVKKEDSREEPLDLNKVIREVVELIRGELMGQELAITLDLQQSLAPVHGDSIQIQQVLLNLILNGAAAMRNAPRDLRKLIVRTSMPDSRSVKAFVRDFGTGIDENNIERLFEPFYTTKPEGLGMGLSISMRIITAHGGTLEAWNNREGGATFAFTLPAYREDPSC